MNERLNPKTVNQNWKEGGGAHDPNRNKKEALVQCL